MRISCIMRIASSSFFWREGLIMGRRARRRRVLSVSCCRELIRGATFMIIGSRSPCRSPPLPAPAPVDPPSPARAPKLPRFPRELRSPDPPELPEGEFEALFPFPSRPARAERFSPPPFPDDWRAFSAEEGGDGGAADSAHAQLPRQGLHCYGG